MLERQSTTVPNTSNASTFGKSEPAISSPCRLHRRVAVRPFAGCYE
jgi:hypothetical protein